MSESTDEMLTASDAPPRATVTAESLRAAHEQFVARTRRPMRRTGRREWAA